MAIRPIYFVILISHTILAVVSVPLVIVLSFVPCAATLKDTDGSRWTLPLWLYLSITGVVVYLLLYRIYPAH